MGALDKLDDNHANFLQAFQAMSSDLPRLNIMVCGKDGSGKGDLVDKAFRENLSATGISKYVCQNLCMVKKEGFPLRVYLTKGLAASEDVSQDVADGIAGVIGKHHADGGDEEAIHCTWYCIDTSRESVEDSELDWVESLAQKADYAGSQLIVCLTNCAREDDVSQLLGRIQSKVQHAGGIVYVLTRDRGESRAHGIETLISITKEALPEKLRQTLLFAARGALREKTKLAHQVVAGATAAAAAAAVTPVPVADTVMLVPIQIGMVSSIAVIFAVDLNKAKVRGFVSAALGALGATLLGKAIFSTSLKLFPGVGQVVGGFINAGTAGIITSALGEVFIKIMTAIYKGEMDDSVFTSRKGKKVIAGMFRDEMDRRSKGKKGSRH